MFTTTSVVLTSRRGIDEDLKGEHPQHLSLRHNPGGVEKYH
jgi:hypothetical protein